jgi:hypothetical protein
LSRLTHCASLQDLQDLGYANSGLESPRVTSTPFSLPPTARAPVHQDWKLPVPLSPFLMEAMPGLFEDTVKKEVEDKVKILEDTVKEAGETVMKEAGDAVVTEAGDTVKEAGDTVMKMAGDRVKRKIGEHSVKDAEEQEVTCEAEPVSREGSMQPEGSCVAASPASSPRACLDVPHTPDTPSPPDERRSSH